MRVLVVVGTRPEAIKLAPVIRSLKKHGAFETRVCLSGQHRELLAQGLEDFLITADDNLNVMTDGQSVNDVVVRVLTGLGAVLERETPDWIIVQGDTSTAMAAGLAAFHHGVRIAHVEAGLRTGDLSQPWPEEMNRRLLGQMATLHFAPTPGARENLLREGVADRHIVVSGNTVIDALILAQEILAGRKPAEGEKADRVKVEGSPADLVTPTVLVTLHRRENLTIDRLEPVERALVRLVREMGCRVVFPVHPNPGLRPMTDRLRQIHPNLILTTPKKYVDFIDLLQQSTLILTDSGGIQEEAAFLGKPVLIMRDSTERPEVLHGGAAWLVGTSEQAILATVSRILQGDAHSQEARQGTNAFGSGGAADIIVRHLLKVCGAGEV